MTSFIVTDDFTPYSEVLPEFACWNCEAKGKLLRYDSEEDRVLCSKCGAIYKREDAVSGKPMWVTNGRYAVRIDQMDDDTLNDLIATVLLKPDLRPGQLIRLLDELEQRRARDARRQRRHSEVCAGDL